MMRFNPLRSLVYISLVSLISLAAQCQRDEFVPPPLCEKAPGEYVQYFFPTCEVSPYKRIYQVGDTITFFTNTSDQFVDSSSGSYFDMTNFPLRPVHSFLRVDADSGTHQYPYFFMPWSIDSIYRPEVLQPNVRDHATRMWAVHDEQTGRFRAEVTFVLTEPGRYLSWWFDVYTATRSSPTGDLTYVDTIPLPDLCEGHTYIIRSAFISGDDHVTDFLREIIYHNDIYNGVHSTIHRDELPLGHPLRNGRRVLEWNGFFAFEVVE